MFQKKKTIKLSKPTPFIRNCPLTSSIRVEPTVEQRKKEQNCNPLHTEITLQKKKQQPKQPKTGSQFQRTPLRDLSTNLFQQTSGGHIQRLQADLFRIQQKSKQKSISAKSRDSFSKFSHSRKLLPNDKFIKDSAKDQDFKGILPEGKNQKQRNSNMFSSGLSFSFKPLYESRDPLKALRIQPQTPPSCPKRTLSAQSSQSKSSKYLSFHNERIQQASFSRINSKAQVQQIKGKKEQGFVSIFDSLASRNSGQVNRFSNFSSQNPSLRSSLQTYNGKKSNSHSGLNDLKKLGQKKQDNVKVYIRIKPYASFYEANSCQNQSSKVSLRVLNDQIVLMGQKLFAFDQVFYKNPQEHIFDQTCLPLLERLFQGFHATIFAYGQTGSGKTHTMFGGQASKDEGLIPRALEYLISKRQQNQGTAKAFEMKCSLVQIYKEQIFDLFNQEQGKGRSLKLKENKERNVYIQSLTERIVGDASEIRETLGVALKHRKVSATRMNETSSRSHTLLTLKVVFSGFETKFSLIDLAGSQQVRKSGVQGETFEETKKINYSLSCLGNVINALTTRSVFDHIPFRDSKLTRLLKDSLCGKFSTAVIVTCAEGEQWAQETLSSLKFAQRAKAVKISPENQAWLAEQRKSTVPSIGSSIDYYYSKIQELARELEETKSQLNKYKDQQTLSQTKQVQVKSKIVPQFREPLVQQGETTNRSLTQETEGELTARMAIPSQRSNVTQLICKYQCQSLVTKHKLGKPQEFSSQNFAASNCSPKVQTNPSDEKIYNLEHNISLERELSLSLQQGNGPLRQNYLFSSKFQQEGLEKTHKYQPEISSQKEAFLQNETSIQEEKSEFQDECTNRLNQVISLNVSNTLYNMGTQIPTQLNACEISIDLSELTSERICSSTQRRQRKIVCLSSSKNSQLSFSFEPLGGPTERGEDSNLSSQRTQKGFLARRTFR